jgi:hypothetical protein
VPDKADPPFVIVAVTAASSAIPPEVLETPAGSIDDPATFVFSAIVLVVATYPKT